MPKGPKGEYRPKETMGSAVAIGKIALGELEDTHEAVKNRKPKTDTEDARIRASQKEGSKRGKAIRSVNKK